MIATFSAPGFHRWGEAPETVRYLRDRHRHLFRFRVEVRVGGGNRECEFHLLRSRALQGLGELWPAVPGGIEFGTDSCESIAQQLLDWLRPETRVTAVEVWEDWENGARVDA